MTDKEKDDLTKSKVGRMMDERIKALTEAQARRDAEQDAQLRPSVAMARVKAGADFTLKYPLASSLAGLAFIAGGVVWLDGPKMWTLVGVGICLVPGLASKAVEFVGGLKKAKE
jgi:hypothetical protein